MKYALNTREPSIQPPESNSSVAGRSEQDHADRERLVSEIDRLMTQKNWSKAETSRQLDMPQGTFSQWHSGKYTGRLDSQNKKVQDFLDSMASAAMVTSSIPVSPGFIQTSVAKEIESTLIAALTLPTMVTVSAEAGIGKTMAANHFCANWPNTHLITASPQTRTPHAVLVELAYTLDVNSGQLFSLPRRIGAQLERKGAGTLLIVDEAQHLSDDAINQLRFFLDNYKCGIALLGNSETYSRFSTAWTQEQTFGQLRSRVFKRAKWDVPPTKDITAFIRKWGIEDPEMTRMLTLIGKKPGALRQIDMTVKLAMIEAAGANEELGIDHLKTAWRNRGVGGV